MRNGIILIDKPAGITSAQVVSRLKRTLQADKVGHAGTLDPDATGLLICLINGGTKAASAGSSSRKTYEGIIRLGVRTSTDDMSGEVLETREEIPDAQTVMDRSAELTGKISQTPPRVSAIQIGGRRAYDMERRGEVFEIEPRHVEVFTFKLEPLSRDTFSYVIDCSAGTYVRSLARDLGQMLGCGGAVQSIRRTSSGPCSISEAVILEGASWSHVRDWSVLYPDVPRLIVPKQIALDLLGGKAVGLKQAASCAWENGITGEGGRLLLYAGTQDGETWGVLRWKDATFLEFVANIIPQADGTALLTGQLGG